MKAQFFKSETRNIVNTETDIYANENEPRLLPPVDVLIEWETATLPHFNFLLFFFLKPHKQYIRMESDFSVVHFRVIIATLSSSLFKIFL